MKTKQANFRLSEQALRDLEFLHHVTGSNRTALIEQAIRLLKAQWLKEQRENSRTGKIYIDPNGDWYE